MKYQEFVKLKQQFDSYIREGWRVYENSYGELKVCYPKNYKELYGLADLAGFYVRGMDIGDVINAISGADEALELVSQAVINKTLSGGGNDESQ